MGEGRAPRIISIGHNCVTKFQIARYFYFQKYPSGTLSDFRNQVVSPADRSIEFDTNIFDWQVTPFPTVVEYIRRDFRGVFEYEHLSIDKARDAAINTHVDTSHIHSFHATGDRLTEQDIGDQYPFVREKFDHLAGKFRSVLASDGPIIYVYLCSHFVPSPWKIAAFFLCVKKRNPKQLFRLAMIGIDGQHEPPMLMWFGGRVSWHTVASSPKKNQFEWEGDDESWGRAIGQLHNSRF